MYDKAFIPPRVCKPTPVPRVYNIAVVGSAIIRPTIEGRQENIGPLSSHHRQSSIKIQAKASMNKSMLKPRSDSVTSAETQHTDRTILDLEIYLSNSSHLRSCVYDHREIQSIAERFGLTPERIRSELRRLGYQLTKNGHGRMIWKSEEGERMNCSKRIASLDEYISKCEARQLQFFDRSELARIAKRNGVDREAVRNALRRRGYKLSRNAHNIVVWIKTQNDESRSLIVGALAGSIISLGNLALRQFLF